MGSKYYICVTYAGFSTQKDKKIAAKVARDYSGSGYGFGERDLSFYFCRKDAAVKAAARARTLHGVKARVYACEEDQESAPASRNLL